MLAQQSPPRPVQVHVTQDPPSSAGPAAAPEAQHVVLHLVLDRPAPTPGTPMASSQAQAQTALATPQAQIAAAELVPTSAVTTTTTRSRVHQPGLVRRTLGHFGQRLSELGQPWTRVPQSTAVVTQAVHQVVVQQPPAAAERVYASPQGSR